MFAKYTAIFIGSVICGIVTQYNLAVPVQWLVGLMVISLSGVGLFVVWRFQIIASLISVCLGFSFGAMLWLNLPLTNEYQNIIGEFIDVEGVLAKPADITSGGSQVLYILPDNYTQQVKVSLFVHINIKSGDRVWLRGKVKLPTNFSDFDYIAYLQKQNVFAEVSSARVIIIKPVEGVKSIIPKLRSWLIDSAIKNLDPPYDALVLGMLVGYKDRLPKDLVEAFRRTGLSHILVVSGFNLTIIAVSLGVLAGRLGRKPSDILSLIVIWIFVFLAGASSAVVRAGVMASILLSARLFGRLSVGMLALLWAVGLMVMFQPLILFFDIGFQLSVTATAGVLFANYIRLSLQTKSQFVEICLTTLGAIVATLPIVAYHFGTFSLVAFFLNLIILPAIPVVMLLGALTFVPVVGVWSAGIVQFILGLEVWLIQIVASWQYSSLPWRPSLFVVVVYYSMLAVVIFVSNKGKKFSN